ncbi:conserved hypothetical protein [Candidatus Terasakiella magnetica]|uniref:MobA/MobL protein domain-containing protein n=1 Tax=Candidatus Terasakiella magnetica TaxID=1867952 RepID=A0A1C3RH67_9PROT|nr:conserved hypothetical protein [Candidatus Terasakiella magnetica]
MACDINIHDENDETETANIHCHLMMITRVVEDDGLGAKTRFLDNKNTSKEYVSNWRNEWKQMVNSQFAYEGIDDSICMDS